MMMELSLIAVFVMFFMIMTILGRQRKYHTELIDALRAIEVKLGVYESSSLPDSSRQTSESEQDTAQREASLAAGYEEPIAIAEVEISPEYPYQQETFQPVATEMAQEERQWAEETPEPSRFELAARQILKEIWNWIIVGEGYRSEQMSIEYAVASNWLLRIGVVILVTGISFFLKYSIDTGLLGEHARVALSVLAGLGMIIAGVRLVGGQYHLFSQGLLGGGIAVLYFSFFAAFSMYHLISAFPAFALMILVTASAGFLAVKLDSMLVAIFAIIGGYCTPILLSTGVVNFVGLFSYMLLLGIGILSVNWYKKWHLLNFLSFFFNYALFFGALSKYNMAYFWDVMPFLIAFFVLYSTMVFLFCLVNRSRSTLLDLIALFINAVIFFGTSYALINAAFGQIWVAAVTLSLAAFYIGHVYYCLARRILDREMLLSFITLAAFFVTITLPLILSRHWITVSWSLQALAMLWISAKVRSTFLRQVAYLIYAIVLIRFCFVDLPSQYGTGISQNAAFSGFLLGLFERLVCFGIPIASLGLAFKWIKAPVSASRLACNEANDIGPWINDRLIIQLIAILGLAMLFIFVQLELYRTLGYLYMPLRAPVLTLVWLILCFGLLIRFLAEPGQLLLRCLHIALAAVLIKLFFFDLNTWDLTLVSGWNSDTSWSPLYGGRYSFEFALMRLLDFAAIIAFMTYAFLRWPASKADSINMKSFFGGTALLLLFVFLSLEINSLLRHYVPGLRSGGVSILWSLFGLSLVFAGIKKQIRFLRLIGLGLFAVVAWKVFFVDLSRLEQIYRIFAFILLGVLTLIGSFAYMKYQQTFFSRATGEPEQ